MADPSKPVTGYPAAQPSYAIRPEPAYNGGYAHPYPAYQGPPPPVYGGYDNRGRYFFRRIMAVIIGLAVVTGIAILITWLVLRPRRPKFYVEDVSVSQFNVTGAQLSSHMDFDLTARNPNKKIGIFYDRIEAAVFLRRGRYDYEKVGVTSLPPFYQGHKNTTTLRPHFSADGVYVGDSRASGSLDLAVKLYVWIRFKVGSWRTRHYYMDVRCYAPVVLNGSSNGRLYRRRKCDVDI